MIIKRVLLNRKVFLESLCSCSSFLYAVLSITLMFYTLDEIKVDTNYKKIAFLALPLLVSLILSIIWANIYPRRVILDETQRRIVVRYGDLWKYAFPICSQKERIAVVNVNNAFDTVVEDPSVAYPLVAANTVHGQWIKQMLARGVNIKEIDKAIENSLKQQNIQPICEYRKTEKPKEKRKLYPAGTVAKYKYRNTTFFLVALSEFDENNTAHNTRSGLETVIERLIDFIGTNGLGCDVYIPLMGSGKSRTGITDSQALDIMSYLFKINKDKFNERVNIVVYSEHRDKLSLY